MGKNFAQMEMRVILAHFFRYFEFAVGGTSTGYNDKTFFGVNRFTMGPQDLATGPGSPNGGLPNLGMYLNITPRTGIPLPKIPAKL